MNTDAINAIREKLAGIEAGQIEATHNTERILRKLDNLPQK